MKIGTILKQIKFSSLDDSRYVYHLIVKIDKNGLHTIGSYNKSDFDNDVIYCYYPNNYLSKFKEIK